ncbi:NAD(P)-dependent oxidoreductase, partial [Streptomyces sp. NPDC058953]|uniref:NAD(P)-dependent oxidoreductase n=1 Tax=Streptomyces sp. NPDC058953 TaxID=3346676 RepID=UPI0036B1ABAD
MRRANVPMDFTDHVHWLSNAMPVTERFVKELDGRSYPLRRFCYRGHLTANAVPVLDWLAGTGVDLEVSSCDENTADPRVVRRLRDAGVSVSTGADSLERLVRWRPELVFDTGGDLTKALIESGRPPLAAVESTSTGLWQLGRLAELPMPVLEWARVPLKEKVEHRFHVAAGVWSAITWLTGLSLEGRRVLVVGYGEVGKGVADRARRLGALVTLAEPPPAPARGARRGGPQSGCSASAPAAPPP